MILTAAFQVVALVVLAAGAAKVASPEPFAALLRSIGSLPGLSGFASMSETAGRRAARVTGIAEVALGATAVVYGGRPVAALVAAAYAVFTVSVLLARRAGAASCGCFGALSAPPAWTHLGINAAATVVAACTAVLDRAEPIEESMSGRALGGAPYAVCVAAAAIAVIAANTRPWTGRPRASRR